MSGKYQAYPDYKATGIDWLPAVPVEWQVLPLKLASANKVKDGPHETPKFLDEGIPFFSVDGIQDCKLVFEGCRYISPEDHKRFSMKCLPKFGDVLLGKAASVGKVAFVDTKEEFNVWSPLAVLTPKSVKLGRFIFYSLQSTWLQAQCDVNSNSNTQKNLSMGVIDNLSFAIPSDDVAEKIANFLDHETAKIDTLIEKQQQLIALLKEKRQTVISHAVTKGLNANAPMRDSGVEWLGDVPEHWVMPKIAHVGRVLNGSTPDKTNLSYWENGTIPWLASGCLNSEIVDEPSLLVSEGAYQSCSIELIPNNSLLVGMVGQGKTRGTSAILAIDSCINQNMAAIIPSEKINVRFLYYLFQAMYEDLRELGRGGNQAALNCEIIGSIRIPLPKMEEQLAIVEMLDALLVKIRNADALGLEQIELLQERRTALISAAVTGKIDVRNWQLDEKEAKE
jgi:type I restriction enzyme S subunit